MGNSITWDAGLEVSAALGRDCIYISVNTFVFICFNLQIQCLVSHIRLGIKYCYVFKACVYVVFDMRHFNKLLLSYYYLLHSHLSFYSSFAFQNCGVQKLNGKPIFRKMRLFTCGIIP